MRLLSALPWILGLVAAASASCQSPSDAAPASTAEYHRDISVVMERYCTGCHTAGGIAPFSLTDYAQVQRYAAPIRAAVSSGTMPPWMPSDAGLPLRYSRQLRPADRDLLLGWIDAGAREGDPSAPRRTDIPAAETVAPPRADLVLDPGKAYAPSGSRTDDYHCFVFDPKLAADTFLTAGDIKPGNTAMVHHVLLYEILAADADSVRQKDAGGSGYTCFGGPGVSGQPSTLFAWVPGSVPARMPDGGALRLHKGSLIVMQVHYNLLAVSGATDRSVAQLEVSATPPAREMYVLPIANPPALSIPAGDPAARQEVQFALGVLLRFFKLPVGTYQLYGASPHMHLLGRRIALSAGPQLVLEIPRWDFHWQQGYQLTAPIAVKATDVLKLDCTYDNSAANQPVVDGVQQTPRDVEWGEGTLDEMCLSYMLLTQQP